MNYLRGAISAASQYYRDINPSTLTGAIDVIVVRRTVDPSPTGAYGSGSGAGSSTTPYGNPNGTTVASTSPEGEEFACSPFHVRFGKWQVLRPSDKKVKVLVNGKEIPFSMKIGDAGEAFFVFETDDEVPENLITSPILEATRPGEINDYVEAGRFGARESTPNSKGSIAARRRREEADRLAEPEPLDLDSTPEANKNTQDSRQLSTPPSPVSSSSRIEPRYNPDDEEFEDQNEFFKPSKLLAKSAAAGKAIVHSVVETDREMRQELSDRNEATGNAARHAYNRVGMLAGVGSSVEDNRGDEALPHVAEGEGDPPPVVYSKDMVIDAAGYHSKNDQLDRQMKETRTKVSTRSLPIPLNDETDDSYEGPSTPRSGDLSADVTPTLSPDTSRSPSPGLESFSRRRQKSHLLPTIRASSEPPDPDAPPPSAFTWEWGAFPTPSPLKPGFGQPVRAETTESVRSSSAPPEAEIDGVQVRPSTPTRAKTTGDRPRETSQGTRVIANDADLSADENNGRRFILSIGGQTYEFELSISEELAVNGKTDDELLGVRYFREGQVSFRRFMKYPGVVNDKNLVIKWNDRYITRRDGSPLMDNLIKWRESALAKPVNARAIEEEEPLSSSDERDPVTEQEVASPAKKTSSSWVRWWRSNRTTESPPKPNYISFAPNLPSAQTSNVNDKDRIRPGLTPSASAPPDSEGVNGPVPFPGLSDSESKSSTTSSRSSGGKRFAKTLRLTSDQLKQLDLKPGMNSITFSLSATGVTACTASIFLWESTDSVVVSDIDGTITKSDALGHIYTMIGRDWTHIGVAKLYTDICRNGYRIMYLTSRAIGQADSTRYYLKGINQNNYQLPEGPVVMSPDRLMASFHREVILKKPEVFKMACLRDIARLFGSGTNPFYAGFGNRITDALSYRSVNIPSARIFTIDHTGEVKLELLDVAGYKSSYIGMTDLVDQRFPPVHKKTVSEFSDFNYWKTPMQEFELPDLTPPSPALSARSETSGQTTFSRIRNFSLRSGSSVVLPSPVNAATRKGLTTMTSLERLSSLGTRSSDSLAGDAKADTRARSRTDEDKEARESKAFNRLSTISMPGSISGDQADFEFDETEEDEMGSDYESEDGEEGYEGEEGDDPEEAAEEGFDDDLLATGEMESVPFL